MGMIFPPPSISEVQGGDGGEFPGDPRTHRHLDSQPVQGSNPPNGVDPNSPAGGDWRLAQLNPEARSRVVNKIAEYLKKHVPFGVPDELNQIQNMAARFEEKIYAEATNRSEYLRKISMKMDSMEMQRQQALGNAQVIPNQNNI